MTFPPWPRRALLALVLVGCVLAAGPAWGAEPGPRAVAAPSAGAALTAVQGLVGALADSAADLEQRVQREPAVPPQALSKAEAIALARGDPDLRDWIDDHGFTRIAAELERDTGQWTVSFVRRADDGKETVEAQVFIADGRSEVTEVRTGPQVAWLMARGYHGAFGRALNDPQIWIPLCAVFLLPLLALRRLVSWRTLDLLALLSFSVSLVWFNRGEIFTSVPLQYPPLVYLAARLAWIGLRRSRARSEPRPGPEQDAPAPVPRPRFAGWCPTWLMIALLVATLGLRYGLNAFDSNVIDVGYAGVIGADRIADGRTPYGTFPSDCSRCDTYGPLVYVSVVPFEQVEPWVGTWNDLPAAHGAASFWDVLCVAGMLVLGWRLSGWRLGLALALAWAAFPFTAFSLLTNSNDALVAAMLIWGLVAVRRPFGRGLFLALAAAAKFTPVVLVPLWWRHPFPRAPGGGLRWLRYVLGLAVGAALTVWVLFLDGLDGVRAFWSRTIGYQLDRESPFSIWGQFPGLRPVQIALTVLVLAAALALWRWPRRLDLLGLVALSGALMVAYQLTLTHWFYLYIPWFLPFALLAFVPEWPAPSRGPLAAEPAPAPAAEREAVPA